MCLYLAEGSKRDRNRVQVCNSDAAVVSVCHDWLGRLSSKPRHYAIQHHADQDIDELRRFWSAALAIPPEVIQFQRKSNSNQLKARTWRSRHGVLAVTVNDTLLRAELDGLDGQASRVLALDCAVRGVAQPGRALGLGPKGHRFESGRPD